ncbi:MAG: hypothetical protein ACRCYS_16545 [Beijerinckiaceae bacterium]
MTTSATPAVNALVEELAQAMAENRGSAMVQWFHRSDAQAILPIITRYGIEQRNAGIEASQSALEADAKLCDCFARMEGECGCGAWDDYKTISSQRAVEIVSSLKD